MLVIYHVVLGLLVTNMSARSVEHEPAPTPPPDSSPRIVSPVGTPDSSLLNLELEEMAAPDARADPNTLEELRSNPDEVQTGNDTHPPGEAPDQGETEDKSEKPEQTFDEKYRNFTASISDVDALEAHIRVMAIKEDEAGIAALTPEMSHAQDTLKDIENAVCFASSLLGADETVHHEFTYGQIDLILECRCSYVTNLKELAAHDKIKQSELEKSLIEARVGKISALQGQETLRTDFEKQIGEMSDQLRRQTTVFEESKVHMEAQFEELRKTLKQKERDYQSQQSILEWQLQQACAERDELQKKMNKEDYDALVKVSEDWRRKVKEAKAEGREEARKELLPQYSVRDIQEAVKVVEPTAITKDKRSMAFLEELADRVRRHTEWIDKMRAEFAQINPTGSSSATGPPPQRSTPTKDPVTTHQLSQALDGLEISKIPNPPQSVPLPEEPEDPSMHFVLEAARELKKIREPKITKFAGGYNVNASLFFNGWLRDVNTYIVTQNLSNLEAVQLVRDFTDKSARDQVDLYMETHTNVIYKDLIAHLRLAFEAGDDVTGLYAQFYARQQGRNESEDQYANALEKLARKILMFDKDFRLRMESGLKHQFINGLKDPHFQALGRQQLRSNPEWSFTKFRHELAYLFGYRASTKKTMSSAVETAKAELGIAEGSAEAEVEAAFVSNKNKGAIPKKPTTSVAPAPVVISSETDPAGRYKGKWHPPRNAAGVDGKMDPSMSCRYCKDTGHEIGNCKRLMAKNKRDAKDALAFRQLQASVANTSDQGTQMEEGNE